MKRTLVLIAGLALSACGGSATPDSTPPTPVQPAASHDGEQAARAEHGDEKNEDHEHDFPAEMKSFHDVMSPVWHSDPGPARIKAACDANDTWVEKAYAVDNGPTPDGVDAEAWKKGTHDLGAAVEDFGRVCENDAAQSEQFLKGIHDAFHVLLDLLPRQES